MRTVTEAFRPRTTMPARLRQFRFLLGPLSALAFLTANVCFAEDVPITERARTHFRAGVNLLQDPDGARYAEAYREFKQAYAESPSWKILGNLGISAMKLERDGEAILAFQTYLKEGGDQIDESERAQMQRDLDTLSSTVTWVTLSSAPAGAEVIDTRIPLAGSPTENRYDTLREPTRLGLRTGRHKITVELEGYEPQTWTFDATGGELSHEFVLVERKVAPNPTTGAAKEYERPVPLGVYIGLGLTGAFAAGAAVTGILALDAKSQFNAAESDADADSARSNGQTLNLVTDILIGGAVVSGVTTTILYLTRPSVEVDPAQTALFGTKKFSLEPSVWSGGGGVSMRGSF